jgi:stage V sporulation protein S
MHSSFESGAKDVEKVIRVSAALHSSVLAGNIAGMVRLGNLPVVHAIGAGAVNQAIKAIVAARGFLAADGIDVVVLPGFDTVQIDGNERSVIKLWIWRPDKPLPPDAHVRKKYSVEPPQS